MIDRTCPKCREYHSCHTHPVVAPVHGRQTPRAVTATCSNGQCQHQWRAVLKRGEDG